MADNNCLTVRHDGDTLRRCPGGGQCRCKVLRRYGRLRETPLYSCGDDLELGPSQGKHRTASRRNFGEPGVDGRSVGGNLGPRIPLEVDYIDDHTSNSVFDKVGLGHDRNVGPNKSGVKTLHQLAGQLLRDP